ncbi:conjugative transfer signal peptidase TraF [Azohydromonas lata]|uniref:conjugative transfer signal peptidase TraF n=1 Tax=Azohydromonas lata TaxID=45677 RepID=UPI000A01E297|nr:conjugative transfer signal peptidase TraF [Azohydromonas lata]
MSRAAHRLGLVVGVLGVLLVLGALIVHVLGLRWNSTASIPRGLYISTDEPVRPGAYVFVCPPPTEPFVLARARGYLDGGACPGQFQGLMKLVVAADHDRVEFAADAVRVNGHALPASRRIEQDGMGRPLPHPVSASTTLDHEVLLMGEGNPKSFDARYFGPVPVSQVQAVIRPVLTF